MFELRKKTSLIHDRVNRLLINDLDLRHFLHGVQGLELFSLYFPYLQKLSRGRLTLPKPPLPTTQWNLKWFLLMSTFVTFKGKKIL